MTDEYVIAAAQVRPGFSEDLSTWRISISRSGKLEQVVTLATSSNMYCGEILHEEAQLQASDIAALLAIVEQIGFRNFKDYYTHETMSVTDLPTWSISVRFGREIKTVEAYGPIDIAREENNQAMKDFVELWDHIHRYAPYPGSIPSGNRIVRTGDDYFDVICDRCDRTNRIRSVAFYRPGLFSYRYSCNCGNRVYVDGVDEDALPESLANTAKLLHCASNVKTEIDHQRRAMPSSAAKQLLRNARLDIPIQEAEGRWLVYRLPDQCRVYFVETSKRYVLARPSGQQKMFDDVQSLIGFLNLQ